MNITENNKLIAEFMGGITSEKNNRIVQGYQNIWLPVHGVCRWDTVEEGRGKILKYHLSWDWLMPVIDKITSNDSYQKYVAQTNILNEGGIFINPKFIKATYNNVVEFIQWYNE